MLKNAQKGSKKVAFLIAANTSKVTFGVLSGTPPESIILRFGVLLRGNPFVGTSQNSWIVNSEPPQSTPLISGRRDHETSILGSLGGPPDSGLKGTDDLLTASTGPPQNLIFFYLGHFPFVCGTKKAPESKKSRKLPPLRDPRWVQKSAPEVTKIDKNWASDDLLCFFVYSQNVTFFNTFGPLGPKRWQKDVKMEVQMVVSKHTKNRWNSTKTLYCIIFLVPSNAQERPKRVPKGCVFNCGKHLQSHFWGADFHWFSFMFACFRWFSLIFIDFLLILRTFHRFSMIFISFLCFSTVFT